MKTKTFNPEFVILKFMVLSLILIKLISFIFFMVGI